jgi:hypothetical protein
LAIDKKWKSCANLSFEEGNRDASSRNCYAADLQSRLDGSREKKLLNSTIKPVMV